MMKQKITLTTYREEIKDGSDLLARVKDMTANPAEMFEDTNWFLPIRDMFNIIDKVFHAKSFGKFFIWDEAELPVMMVGRFVPLLWSELVHFYLKQMVLVKGDLMELSDWKSRGSLETGNVDKTVDGTLTSKTEDVSNETGDVTDNTTITRTNDLDGNVKSDGSAHNDTASTSYSQPTETGHKWNDSLDAPSSKSIVDSTIQNTTTTTNKIKEDTTQDKTTKANKEIDRNINKDDVKSDKEKQQYDKNMSNRVNDMKNLLSLSLSLYFTNIFYKFERFFIDGSWVEENYG